MVTGRHRWTTPLGASLALVVAAALGAGCSSTETSDPVQQRDRDSSPDAPDTGGHGRDSASSVDGSDTDVSAADSGDTSGGGASSGASGGDASGGDASAAIAAALDARATNDPQAFVLLIDDARAACADPSAQNRLDELGVLAARWADALADGRPKVQAVTERQLSAADWDGLADACSRA